MKKFFTKAQKDMLRQKVVARNIAQASLDEFVGYLREEHEVDATWQINNDGFDKPEVKTTTEA